MAYTEFNIDGQYALFARFYCAFDTGVDGNPFFQSHRSQMPTSTQLDLWNNLDGLNIFAELPNHDKLAPMTANLVLPAGDATGPFPLAVLVHGNARSYFKMVNGVNTAIPEVKSYRGYQYLQYYLADRGVASLSINCNLINYIDARTNGVDEQMRVQMAFLWLAVLKQLAGTAASSNQPIYMKMSAGGTVSPLQDALNVTTGAAESLVQALRLAIRNKIDFTKLGFMGHSRGGGAVQILEPFFKSRNGTAPANYSHHGAVNPTSKDFTSAQDMNANDASPGPIRLHDLLYHYTMDIAAFIGSPGLATLKVVIALQPNMGETLLANPSTFFLAIASSHDTDVDNKAYGSYYESTCPKAFMVSHGASHARFNTVWRQLDYLNTAINQQIACQSPIHMLSNAAHEDGCKAMVGNAFLGALLGEGHRWRFYTGEVRATSLGQDIDRGWKFGYPFTSPPAVIGLSGRTLDVQELPQHTPSTLTTGRGFAGFRYFDGPYYYSDPSKIFIYTRPAASRLKVSIPILASDQLVARTHFSFIYGLEYNCRSRRTRRRVNLQNYVVRLQGNGGAIGSDVDGRDVRVKSFVAYPTFERPGGTCDDDTEIVFQTAEVELAQFLTPQSRAVTDLNQVTAIEIEVKSNGSSGNVTWFFNDFAITTRNLPMPPPGFAIP